MDRDCQADPVDAVLAENPNGMEPKSSLGRTDPPVWVRAALCRRGRPWFAALLLALTVTVVFGRVCTHDFLAWDDPQNVLKNPRVNPPSWRGLGQCWQEAYWGLYCPLSYTFFAAEAALAQSSSDQGGRAVLRPAYFHAGNLALHIACVLLAFVLLRRILARGVDRQGETPPGRNSAVRDAAACGGALLFGLHPLQVESVAWISEARGLLCAVFAMVALWQYVEYSEFSRSRRSRIVHYVVATGALLLALVSKPTAVAVPLVVGALELGLWRRPFGRVFWPLAPWLAAAAVVAAGTRSLQSESLLPWVPPLPVRPLVAADALRHDLVTLVAPLWLTPDYGRSPRWLMDQGWISLAGAPILLAALLALMGLGRSRRMWWTFTAVFVACIVPVLGLVPFHFQRISTVADRYLYLALLGPAAAWAWWLSHGSIRWVFRANLALIVSLGWMSFIQASYWRNDRTLFAHAFTVNSRSTVARYHLGILAARDQRQTDAVAHYRAGLAEDPSCLELYIELGNSLVALRQTAGAREVLDKAAVLFPDSPVVHHNLANVLSAQGAVDEAVRHYKRALRFQPRYADAHLGLGKALLGRGQYAEASKHFQRALDISPDKAVAHVNWGAALDALGQTTEARKHYWAALEIQPGFAAAHFNLGNLALREPGGLDQAVAHYQAAIHSDYASAPVHANLGAALLEQGLTAEAVQRERTALWLDPELVQAHVLLGRALARQGRHPEAAAAFRAALDRVAPESDTASQLRRWLKPEAKP
ncbi:MAG: tetratricopeptide repeat protein [Thermoguttaceae bacterium]